MKAIHEESNSHLPPKITDRIRESIICLKGAMHGNLDLLYSTLAVITTTRESYKRDVWAAQVRQLYDYVTLHSETTSDDTLNSVVHAVSDLSCLVQCKGATAQAELDRRIASAPVNDAEHYNQAVSVLSSQVCEYTWYIYLSSDLIGETTTDKGTI